MLCLAKTSCNLCLSSLTRLTPWVVALVKLVAVSLSRLSSRSGRSSSDVEEVCCFLLRLGLGGVGGILIRGSFSVMSSSELAVLPAELLVAAQSGPNTVLLATGDRITRCAHTGVRL